MKRLFVVSLLLTLIAVLAVISARGADAPQIKYEFKIIAYPGAISTAASGINDHGDIVGTYNDVIGSQAHAFLLRDGRYYQIDKPGAFRSRAMGINNAGQIVGTADELRGTDTDQHAFLRIDENTYMTVEPPGFRTSLALAINNRGDIVGIAVPSSSPQFLFGSNGQFYPGLAGPYGLWAYALNSTRQYVGYNVPNSPDPYCGCFDSYLSDANGTKTTILAVPGAHLTQANAINDFGDVAGNYVVYDNPGINETVRRMSGFIYSDGIYKDLQFPGAVRTQLKGINGFGDVVGVYSTGTVTQAFVAIAERPFTTASIDDGRPPATFQRIIKAREENRVNPQGPPLR